MRKPSSSTASLEGAAAAQAAPLSARLAWTAVGLLWVAFFINYVDRQVVFSIFPVLRRELDFTNEQLGLIGSIFIWVYSLCSPLVGRVADVIRRERVIVASLVLWSLATLSTGLSTTAEIFLFWRAVMGVSEALYAPAAMSLIGALHAGPTRSRALAVHGTAQLAGIIAGSWYGGWMADRAGWRTAFTVLTAVGLAYTPVLWWAFRRLPDLQAPTARQQGSVGDIFRSRCYLALLVAFLALLVMLWMLYAWLPHFVYERYHLTLAESGLMATLYLQVSSIAGILCGGMLGDWAVRRLRSGRYYIAGFGLLLCAPFAYLTLAVHSLAWLKAASAGFGFFSGIMIANNFASAYDVISPRNYGLAAGTMNLVGGLAGGVGIFLAGRWKESVGIESLMLWSAVSAATAGVLLMVVAGRRLEEDRRGAGIA